MVYSLYIYKFDLHFTPSPECSIYTGCLLLLSRYMFRPSQLFSMTLYIATSSIVPLSKQRHERKEHSQRRMALNGRLIYRTYRAYMKNITTLES